MDDKVEMFIDSLIEELESCNDRAGLYSSLASVIERTRIRMHQKEDEQIEQDEETYNSCFDNYGSY